MESIIALIKYNKGNYKKITIEHLYIVSSMQLPFKVN